MSKLSEKSNEELLLKATESEVFKLAVKSAFNHIIITDCEGVIVFVNSAAEHITGYSKDEIIGQTPRLWGKQMPTEFYRNLWKTIKVDKKPFKGEVVNKRKDGSMYVARTLIAPVLDDNRNLLGFVSTEEDLTKVKELERMHSEFISITAHQLKTPLSSISWNLDRLKNALDGKGGVNVKESLDSIAKSNSELITLVDNLLNISRIESGELAIMPENVNCKMLITEVIESSKSNLGQKYIEINLKDACDRELPLDSKVFKEVLKTLLDNAIKYSAENSEIKVSSYVDERVNILVIRVEDQGFGIPQLEQEKVFEKYFRSRLAISKGINGNGLSLYAAKLLVGAYGGDIWFESSEGKGTTFFFSVPLDGMKQKDGQVSLG